HHRGRRRRGGRRAGRVPARARLSRSRSRIGWPGHVGAGSGLCNRGEERYSPLAVDSREDVMLTLLNEAAIATALLQQTPSEHVVVGAAVKRTYEASVLAGAPTIRSSGSFALSSVRYGPGFAALLAEMVSEPFRRLVESKFGIDLHAYPPMLTVRGFCSRERDRDGYIHTDSRQKIISVLLYLNSGWAGTAGALRVLRSRDIDDCALEIAPEFGRMLTFRRSDPSWPPPVPSPPPPLTL